MNCVNIEGGLIGMMSSRLLLVFLILVISINVVYANTIDNPEQTLDIGWYQFNSEPQGEVIFDGISYGLTPVSIPVRTESNPFHEVIIKIEGYEEYSRQLTENPEPGQIIPISLNTHLIANIQKLLSE